MVSGLNKRVYGQNINLGLSVNLQFCSNEAQKMFFGIFGDEMKSLELEDLNGIYKKFRGFMERAKKKF